jgi:hypothetical protein
MKAIGIAVMGALGVAALATGVGWGRSAHVSHASFDFRYSAAVVERAGDRVFLAGRGHSTALRKSGALVLNTYPSGATRHADYTIYFRDGSVSGTLTPSDTGLPPGEPDPTVVGAHGTARGTGRFHGLVGYVEMSDNSGPGNGPNVTADGIHHQDFDVCLATRAQLRSRCGTAPTAGAG